MKGNDCALSISGNDYNWQIFINVITFCEGIAFLNRKEKCSNDKFIIPSLELLTVLESEYVREPPEVNQI